MNQANHVVKGGFSSEDVAMAYYIANGGNTNGWKIVDSQHKLISTSGSKTNSPFEIYANNNDLIKGGLPNYESAIGYYSGNNGKSKSWIIVDAKGLKVN